MLCSLHGCILYTTLTYLLNTLSFLSWERCAYFFRVLVLGSHALTLLWRPSGLSLIFASDPIFSSPRVFACLLFYLLPAIAVCEYRSGRLAGEMVEHR